MVPFLDMVCLILRSHVGTDVWPVPVRADAVVMLRGEGGRSEAIVRSVLGGTVSLVMKFHWYFGMFLTKGPCF